MAPGDNAPPSIERFHWLGSDHRFLDDPTIECCGPVIIGRYGGNKHSGADKNEDAAMVWCDASGSWEFAVLLDAHVSGDSAELVLSTIEAEEDAIRHLLSQPAATAFGSLENHLVKLFSSAQFLADCQALHGETACLIAVRKAQFLWWFNVGDCIVHLLHPDLASMGQVALNQRSYYEWIGRVNTFNLPTPCYSSGVRELRSGINVVVLTTDGLLQSDSLPFALPENIYRWFYLDGAWKEFTNLSDRVHDALSLVHMNLGRDSATILAWSVDNEQAAAHPSG